MTTIQCSVTNVHALAHVAKSKITTIQCHQEPCFNVYASAYVVTPQEKQNSSVSPTRVLLEADSVSTPPRKEK